MKDDLSLAGKGTQPRYRTRNIPLEEALLQAVEKVMGSSSKVIRARRGEVIVDKGSIRPILSALKDSGLDHFVALTCIDLIKEGKFGLVYHLWSYGSRSHVFVRTKVDRKAPSIDSVYDIYRPAITYEREIKEMFGVDFPGNPRLTQFILEDWEGIPPMRKDFDLRGYAKETFAVQEKAR